MSRLYRTEGIVMHRREQGDADRVLTLCTPQGKLVVMAKGARKLRSRKAGHIELFTRANFVISHVPNYWDIISQAEMVAPHAVLRSDLLRGAYARYVIELLDRFFTEGEGEHALFDLLNHTLSWLCEDDDLELAARFYEQHLLGLAGFRPEMFRCVGQHDGVAPIRPCAGERDANRSYGFDPERGGVLCPDCYERETRPPVIIPAAPHVIQFLQHCQQGSYTRLRAQAIAPALHTEVERVMQHYITYHLEQGVKSAVFLRQLRQATMPLPPSGVHHVG